MRMIRLPSSDGGARRWRFTAVGATVAAAATGAAFALAGGPAQAAPVSWSSMNFDYNNSRANTAETTISAANAGTLAPKWKATDLYSDTSTPAVVNGVVYTGAYDGTVRAYDEATGKLKWKTKVSYTLLGSVDDSPAVADGKVFVGTGEGFVVALDAATGRKLWQHASGNTDPHIYSSAVVVEGHVIIGSASEEVAELKAKNTSRGSVMSLDENTGTLQWQFFDTDANATSGAGGSVWSSAAIDPNLKMAYIGTGQNVSGPNSQYTDSLLALNYETGQLVWHQQYSNPDIYRVLDPGSGHDFDIGASPNLFTVNGRAVVSAGDKGGNIAVFDRATGQKLWSKNYVRGSHLGGDMTTAAVHNGVIYVTENWWTTPFELPVTDFDTTTVYALDGATGNVIWSKKLPKPAFGDVTWANGLVYVPTIYGKLYIFKDNDGTQVNAIQLPNALGGGVSVIDGTLFTGYGMGTPQGGLIAFTPGGK